MIIVRNRNTAQKYFFYFLNKTKNSHKFLHQSIVNCCSFTLNGRKCNMKFQSQVINGILLNGNKINFACYYYVNFEWNIKIEEMKQINSVDQLILFMFIHYICMFMVWLWYDMICMEKVFSFFFNKNIVIYYLCCVVGIDEEIIGDLFCIRCFF